MIFLYDSKFIMYIILILIILLEKFKLLNYHFYIKLINNIFIHLFLYTLNNNIFILFYFVMDK